MNSQPIQFRREFEKILADAGEHGFVVTDDVHLVHCHGQHRGSQQPGNVCVPPCLRKDAIARVNQYDGQFSGGGPGRHVTRVLLVTWRVGNDKLAPRR